MSARGVLCGAERLATLLALASVGTCLAAPAHALTSRRSPGALCGAEQSALRVQEEATRLLSPADGAKLPEGSFVTFSASSGVQITFSVADSPERLAASPDIDHGSGTAQRESGTYSFTSKKAAADPGTVYWAVTFTRTLSGCEGPSGSATYTTPPRKLVIVPSASNPSGIPRGMRRALLRRAERVAAGFGERRPRDVQIVLTTHKEADRAQGGNRIHVPLDESVYLFAMRGHFCEPAHRPSGRRRCAPFVSAQFSIRWDPDQADGWGVAELADRYPNLKALGLPVRLDRSRGR
jgi:hypothetical protein